ncbi:MAG: DNA-processing protein DprA [Rhodoblastus sp.]|nr:DNA-processing protein DprA [Rhodoblastus sp.]
MRCDNVGPRTFRALINKFGGAGAALAALPDLLRNAKGERAIRIFARDEAEREIVAAAKAGARYVALGEADYPATLRAIDSPPPLIAIRGRVETLARPAVAIVGSRNASAAGLAMAERLARVLAKEGIVVISGLARGIDAAAHRASLAGGTVAALAGGHARLYPAEHRDLAQTICETGALVSEMPHEWEPRGRDFPRRNRIVSGLALATVVVEAARRSGSLITARFAGEQGREVFAVPGSPLDPRAEGTNDLLRSGATLCTRAEDILDTIAPMIEGGAPRADLFDEDAAAARTEPLWDESDLFDVGASAPPRTLPDHEMNEPREDFQYARPAVMGADAALERVSALLGPSPIGVDDLLRAAQLPAQAVHTALLELEIEGRLARHGGNRVSLAPET